MPERADTGRPASSPSMAQHRSLLDAAEHHRAVVDARLEMAKDADLHMRERIAVWQPNQLSAPRSTPGLCDRP